jgi:hypothetical protein
VRCPFVSLLTLAKNVISVGLELNVSIIMPKNKTQFIEL